MPTRAIPYVKLLVHLFLLNPIVWLTRQYLHGSLANDPDPVNTITHFTGNWALWILLASLAITPLRRLTPRLANLIRFRRLLGLYAFFYATLHLATYVFLFSGFDVTAAWTGLRAGHLGPSFAQLRAVWPTMLGDLQKRRFIQIGLVSWLILLALAITSPTRMLRTMGGKSWQTLHRLVYGAAAAACIHFWWLVKAGVRTPWKDSAILAVLLLARILWIAQDRRRKARLAVSRAPQLQSQPQG